MKDETLLSYEFDFEHYNDAAWLHAVANQPTVHGVTAAILAKLAIELNKRLDSTIQSGNSAQPVTNTYTSPGERLLRLFDEAVGAELPRISHLQYDGHEICAHFAKQVRAAMLQAGDTVSGNSFSDLDLEGMSHGNNPQANAYRELLAYRRNSPAIPDGYVMVPKEPTDEMIAAAMNCDDVEFNSDETFCVQFGNIYEAMLAAAPQDTPALNSLQSVDSVAGRWIPVSEWMPETDGNYWGWWSESKRQGPVWFIKSELQAQFQSHEITHWMPLPAAPQEVKGE